MSAYLLNYYVFQELTDAARTGAALRKRAAELGLRGALLLAPEGVNAALAGSRENLAAWLERLLELAPHEADPERLRWTDLSEGGRIPTPRIPFRKLTLKVKDEIIKSAWESQIDFERSTHLSPEEWQRIIESDPDAVLLDTRNNYEWELGAFAGAVRLPIHEFRRLPDQLPELEQYRGKKLLTYCTGGVRCEKVAPWLREQGFEAYQLDGGILNYFEKIPDGNWEGECFVFDGRVSITPDMRRGRHVFCPGCGQAAPQETGVCARCAQTGSVKPRQPAGR